MGDVKKQVIPIPNGLKFVFGGSAGKIKLFLQILDDSKLFKTSLL